MQMRRNEIRPHCLAVLVLVLWMGNAHAEVVRLQAKDTVSALEMDHGDTLEFRLRSGRVFTLVLEDTSAAIVERVVPGGIVYRFSMRVRVDGRPMTLERYVCSRECFYEPYVIDGVRIWPDTVKDVFDLVPIRYPRKGNLRCLPRKSARLALQDATLRICPPRMHPWIDDERNFLELGNCYNGDDCYLGPYLGQACHVGLDVNHAKGSLLFAPIDFDTHAYFNSLAAGDNNNRWRAVRRWVGGDVWALQSHHLIELLVAEAAPLEAGTKYATTAGVHVGSHQHTHFEFKIGRPRNTPSADRPAGDGPKAKSLAAVIDFDDQSTLAQADPEVLHLDPWIVFWQIFEDRKARQGMIRAAMGPLRPGRTGRRVTFSARGSRAGPGGGKPECYWTFGDGGWGRGSEASHVFARPGVYPVTLVVDDGVDRAGCTQHISVSGEPVPRPVLVLSAPDEPSFRRRPVHALDVYGDPVRLVPHTLQFVARRSRPVPEPKLVQLHNLGGGRLADAEITEIRYGAAAGWLAVTPGRAGGRQWLEVTADAGDLQPGTYGALVSVACGGAVGSPRGFRVELRIAGDRPQSEVTVDDGDKGFFATPYFWVGHRFCRCPRDRRGHGGFYLTNGGRSTAGEFARFTPDLRAGLYEVRLSDQTPFRSGTELSILVRHRGGKQHVRVKPDESRVIGTFEFDQGGDGFVELRAGGSKGLAIADAVVFRPAREAGNGP